MQQARAKYTFEIREMHTKQPCLFVKTLQITNKKLFYVKQTEISRKTKLEPEGTKSLLQK